MEPFEIMVSESQERMLCVVEPDRVDSVLEVCRHWEVTATAIGTVTDEDTVRVDGTFNIDDFNSQFETDLPAEDYHTIGGFVFGELGRPAEPGDEVTHDGMVFRVDSVEGQRIEKLTVTFGWRHRPSEQEAED